MPLVLALFGLLLAPAQAAPSATQPAAQPTPEKAELCAVAGSGAKFSGRYLEITGTIAGSQPDHLLLTSPQCPFAVKLAFSPEVQAHDDVRILFATLKRVNAGGVTVTVEGRYLYSDQASTVGLQVEGIDHLEFPKQ